MHCVVTAGPTFEPLDEVRRLTNLSTGQLGSGLADHLAARGHEVLLLRGAGATFRRASSALSLLEFTTTSDLGMHLAALAGSEVQAVFHAAAVADFGFGRVFEHDPHGSLRPRQDRKIPTSASNLLVELRPTPKLIARLRGWFPTAWLVAWKYEVEGERARAVEAARDQIARNRTDACVVNGPGYGEGFGFVTVTDEPCHLPSPSSLYHILESRLADWDSRRERPAG